MTRDELEAAMLAALFDIVPEAETVPLLADRSLRDQLDIDSMDILNFAIAIHERTTIDVPERDYPELETLAGALSYLLGRAGITNP